MSEKEALLPTKRVFLQLMLLKGATAQYQQTICAVKPHTAHLQHSKTMNSSCYEFIVRPICGIITSPHYFPISQAQGGDL